MRATASNLHRLAHCTYWAREDVQWTPIEDSAESIDGTQTHALAAGVDVPDATPRARQLHRSYRQWCADTGAHFDVRRELVMAYDLASDTARIVESAGERDYSGRRSTEVIGTFDVVGAGYVDDLKTGQPENAHVEQLLLGALCIARHGIHEVGAGFVFLREDRVWRQAYEFDSIELDAFADWLRERDAVTPGSAPNPGSHCRYCPAAATCPATQQALARVVAETPVLPSPHRLPLHASEITSPEHAAWTYGQLRAVKQIEAHVWAALRAYAERAPIDLGGGRVWGRKTTRRESIELSGVESISALKQSLGERWESACSFEVSKASIARAARGGPEPVAKVLRETLAALRAIGAVSVKESVTYDETEAANDAAE
jgi:hypothetical protein